MWDRALSAHGHYIRICLQAMILVSTSYLGSSSPLPALISAPVFRKMKHFQQFPCGLRFRLLHSDEGLFGTPLPGAQASLPALFPRNEECITPKLGVLPPASLFRSGVGVRLSAAAQSWQSPLCHLPLCVHHPPP